MKQQETRKRTFFAFGSPQFVLGSFLINELINGDVFDDVEITKEEQEKFNRGFKKFLISFCIIILICSIWFQIKIENEYIERQQQFQKEFKEQQEQNKIIPGGWNDLSTMGKHKKSKLK
jgi:hypothetical protein